LSSINREILGDRGKTLEEAISAFEAGEYGEPSVMAPVVAILTQRNGESLKKNFPEKLVDFFVETLKRTPPHEGIREGREGETEKDYLAYKILQCAGVAGYPMLDSGEPEGGNPIDQGECENGNQELTQE
jgi:hypothetical protein